jgi:hypothetical protein
MEVVIFDNTDRKDPRAYKLVPTSTLRGEADDDFIVLPFLTGVAVKRQFKMPTEISFSIDVPYELGLDMLNSTMFMTQNVVTVKIGYPEGPVSQTYYGILLKGGLGLEVNAEGLSGTLTANPLSKGAFYSGSDGDGRPLSIGGKNFGERTKEYALAAAVKSMGGYEADFSEVNFPVNPPTEEEFAATPHQARYQEGETEETMKFRQGAVTNIERIRSLCKEMGWTYEIIYDDEREVPAVKFYQYSKISKKAPVWELVMRGRFAPESNRIPMISFTPEIGAGWYAVAPLGGEAAAQRVKSGSVDSEGNISVNMAEPEGSDIEGGDDSEQGGSTSPKDVAAKIALSRAASAGAGIGVVIDSALSLLGDPNSQHIVTDPEVANGERDAILRVVQDDARRDHQSWEAGIVIPGTPQMVPSENLKVVGVGAFDRTYTIRSVTHNVAIGSYETTVTCYCGEPGTPGQANTKPLGT